MIPQLLLLFLFAVTLGAHIADHGKPRTGTDNAWRFFVSLVLHLSLLYWAGFFDVFRSTGGLP